VCVCVCVCVCVVLHMFLASAFTDLLFLFFAKGSFHFGQHTCAHLDQQVCALRAAYVTSALLL